MIKAKVFEVAVEGIRIIIQPKGDGHLAVYPLVSTYMYKTATGERCGDFKFDNSHYELIRSMGKAFIEAADFVKTLEAV